MKVLISGASGFLGRQLTAHFQSGGHTVLPIQRVRTPDPLPDAVAWHAASDWLDLSAMDGAEVVIHLAGENIANGRWTRAKRQRILNSRVNGTQQLVQALEQVSHRPKTFLCASATGYYGSSDEPRRESDPPGTDFLASVCVAWEDAARMATRLGIRTLSLRFGVILDPSGGALRKMRLPFQLGLGGRLGSGKQYFPWIAAPEIPLILDYLLECELSGPINFVAPQAVTNATFTRTLARHLHRPAVIPLPAFAIGMLFGEMGKATLLSSCQATPSALTEHGYPFRYPTLDDALATIWPKG